MRLEDCWSICRQCCNRLSQVGNFRVEPPGLFRGRGEHPKMGKYKRRIYPRDVTINVGKGVHIEVPEPYRSQGQKWKEVRCFAKPIMPDG